MPPTNDDADDIEEILRQAALTLRERSHRLDELKRALKDADVEIAETTGNVCIRNRDGENLLVLSPEDAASLGSTLSLKAHEAVNTEENDG